MITLSPVAVTGSPLTVNWSQQYPGSATANPIRVANESPYQAVITVRGVVLVLQPYTADVLVPAGSATQLTAVFTALSSPLPAAPVSQLIVTLAQDGETFSGTYPMALSRQQAAFGQQSIIGTATASAGNPSATLTLPLPAGTQCVGFMVHLNGANLGPQSLFIRGTQTQNVYLNPSFPPANAFGVQWAEVAISDTSVDVQITASASGPATVDFLATPLVTDVAVRAESGKTLPVFLSGSFGAPWQAARVIQALNITLNPGGIQHIIAGSPGLTIYLFDIDYDYGGSGVSSGNGQFQDTSGNVIHGLVNFAGSRKTTYSGSPLTAGSGAGLDFNVSGANASAFLVGHVAYTQA